MEKLQDASGLNGSQILNSLLTKLNETNGTVSGEGFGGAAATIAIAFLPFALVIAIFSFLLLHFQNDIADMVSNDVEELLPA